MDSECKCSQSQLQLIVEFMRKHPEIAHKKMRNGISYQKFSKLWADLTQMVNRLDGATKTSNGWVKFWKDKRRSIVLKNKDIANGKSNAKLTDLEQEIIDIYGKPLKKKKSENMKLNGNIEDTTEESIDDDDDDKEMGEFSNNSEEQQLNLIEKMVEVMDEQAKAMAEIAQAHLDQSKSMERLAEASRIQAMAAQRMANTIECVSLSVHNVRNALLGIDYSLKSYPTTATVLRQNSNNLFN